MTRVIFVFELIYTDIVYIISINIDGVTGFNNFINDYSRYHHINICIQKKDVFQNLINF